ncbi:unnamed protein product, partial [Ectocarpus fasciculatus]
LQHLDLQKLRTRSIEACAQFLLFVLQEHQEVAGPNDESTSFQGDAAKAAESTTHASSRLHLCCCWRMEPSWSKGCHHRCVLRTICAREHCKHQHAAVWKSSKRFGRTLVSTPGQQQRMVIKSWCRKTNRW